MLKIVAEFKVKGDCLEKFKELTQIIVEKTNTLDQGCISYALYQDNNDPLHCSMIEEWESQEMLDKHMQAPHFIELVPQIDGFCSAPVNVTVYKKLY